MKTAGHRTRKTTAARDASRSRPRTPSPWETRLCELELRLTQLESENRRLRAACQQLEAVSARHARLHDLASVGLLTLDAHGLILDINRAGAALLGREKNQLARRRFTFLVAPADIPKFTAHLRRCLRSRKAISTDLRLRETGGGGPVVVQLASLPVLDQKSRPPQLQTTLIDITSRRRAEEALRAGERDLHALIEASPHPIQLKDATARWQLANHAALELFELTGVDYRNKRNSELSAHSPFYRAELEAGERKDRAVMEAGQPARSDEIIPKPNGSTRILDVIRVPLLLADGRPKGLLVLGYDITERARAEEAIRAQEVQLQFIADTTPVMLTRCSRDLRYLFVNRAYAAMLGVAPEQVVGKPIVEIMGAEGFESIRPYVETVLQGRPVEFEQSVRYARVGLRFMRAAYMPDRDQQGNVRGWVASLSDITERKRAEDALRESQARFRNLADSAPVLIWMSDTDKRCFYFNKRWLEFTGRTLEQELGDGWAEGVHPDDLQRCLETYVTAFDARREFQMEYRLRRHDGEYRWILDHGVPRFSGANEFVGYIGSCIDTTERKQAAEVLLQARDELEQRVRERTAALTRANEALLSEVRTRKQAEVALRASEATFRGFVESAPDAIVIVDQAGRIYLVNAQTERLFNYTRKELQGQPVELLMPRRYHVRHRGHRGDYLAEPQTRPMGTGLELFGRRKDGSEFPIEIGLSPLQSQEGALVCAAIRDISERKRAEKALRESEARLQAITDNSPSLIFLKDREGRYLHFNRRFEQAFHLPLKQAVGKTDAEIFPPMQAAAFRANDLKVIETGVPVQFDEIAAQDDGPHTSIVTKFPLYDVDGKLYAVGGIVTDITERKRLETELVRISEREQRRIAQDLHDGLGQQLAGISCLSSVLQQNLAERASPDAATAARISRMLDVTVSQTRNLARGLYPVAQEPGGLMSALEDLAANITGVFKVTCRFECPSPVLIENNDAATHIYRIAQEAVANAIKHGRAKRIKIGLSSTLERIVLAVSNDGAAFSKAMPRRKGLGMRIMNHRAEMLGGTLAFQRKAGGRNQVVCTVPKINGPDTPTG